MTPQDKRRLRQALTEAGAFEHCPARTVGKLMTMATLALCLYLGALYVATTASTILALAMLLVAAFPMVTAAMVGHEGAHRSFASKPWQNELLAHAAFPFMAGLSLLHWKQKHNVKHHGHPNIEGIDEDIDLWPMATSSDIYESSSAPRRFFQRNFQGFLYWPLTLFLTTVMRLQSVRHLRWHAANRGFNAAFWSDALCLVAHYLIWLVLPSLILGPMLAIGAYLFMWAIGGLLLALVFTPAHIGLPILQTDARGWKHQLDTTRNLKMPGWLSFFFVGLDYQVEHHIFPKIPHQKLPRTAAIFKTWCNEVGLPYHEIGYGASVADSTRFMANAWKIAVDTQAPASNQGVAEQAA